MQITSINNIKKLFQGMVLVLIALFTRQGYTQISCPMEPDNPNAPVPATTYHSPFRNYHSQRTLQRKDWQSVNKQAQQSSSHMGHGMSTMGPMPSMQQKANPVSSLKSDTMPDRKNHANH